MCGASITATLDQMTRTARFIARAKITLKRSRLLRWGVSATFLWLLSILIYLAAFANTSDLKSPNLFGDFLAGVFAPVAFFWLIVTVLMQSRELRLQRRELVLNRNALNLQADEMRNSVEQFRKQTELRQSDAQTREREKTTRIFDEGYEQIGETLLLTLGAWGDVVVPYNGTKYRFPTVAALRAARVQEGLAKVLFDQQSDWNKKFKFPGEGLISILAGNHRFRVLAARFMIEFDSWLNGVRHHHLFDLEQRALSDGMVAMRQLIGEILQSALAPDEPSDEPPEAQPENS